MDNLIKLIPAAFLYFGFVYLDSYFRFFDISIASFYGFDEFIVVFLPIIDILIPFAFLLILLWAFIYFYNHKDLLNIRVIDLRLNLKRINLIADVKIRNRFKNVSSRRIKWAAFYYLIANTTVISFVIFFILNYKTKHLEGYDSLFSSLFGSFFFTLFIYDVLKIFSLKFPKIKIPTTSITFVLYLTLFWGFTKKLGKENARSTTSNTQSVSFQYEGISYKTSRDTIIIGDTKRYLILRSIRNSTNLFFERDKISSLQTKK